MRKIKIFVTILVLYEFAVLTVLQIPDHCVWFFNQNFCAQMNFKYFLLCLLFPAMIGLVFWWTPEISRLFSKNKCVCEPKNTNAFSEQNLENLLVGIANIGLEKLLEHRKRSATSRRKNSKNISN